MADDTEGKLEPVLYRTSGASFLKTPETPGAKTALFRPPAQALHPAR